MTFELLTGQMQALTMLIDDYSDRVARGDEGDDDEEEEEGAAVEEGAEA